MYKRQGLFGGAVANPANVLARLVAQLTDAEGRVTIPGFYDDVRELTPAERRAFNRAPFSLAAYKKSLAIGDVEGEAGYTTLERTGAVSYTHLVGVSMFERISTRKVDLKPISIGCPS